MAVFALMGDMEKQYSVPQTLTVCHDNSRLMAVQLGLQMRHEKAFEPSELLDASVYYAYYQQVDRRVAESLPRRMSLVGSYEYPDQCETIQLASMGFLRYVWLHSDQSGIRALKIKMSNGKQITFGLQNADGL